MGRMVTASFYIDEELLMVFDKICVIKCKTRSSVLKELILTYVAQNYHILRKYAHEVSGCECLTGRKIILPKEIDVKKYRR
jgi:metal-responsive CopG/Arc/MetJ family transcriptional regulator